MKFDTFKHNESVDDLNQYFEELKTYVNSRFPVCDAETRKDLCELVSRFVKDFLDGRNINSVIIEGEIRLANQEYLAHSINLVLLGKNAWVIDFTSKQIPKLRNKDWIFQKLPNKRLVIEDFLKEKYDWWFKSK